MTKYDIFQHPDGRIEAVKDGFSFPGCLLGGFWALYHKMWIAATISFVLGFGAYIVLPSPAFYFAGVPFGHRFGIADLINIGLMIAFGMMGNGWRYNNLVARGYEWRSDVEASTPDGAKASFLRNPVHPFSGVERQEPL
jgi:hypothetical protein